MYSLDEIVELIQSGKTSISDTIEVELGDVICRSYDDLIDLLDEALCECYLPKADCYYKLISCTEGFYHATLKFLVVIDIDVERFKAEYEEY